MNVMLSGSAAIVFGATRKDYESFLPADSFIFVKDYSDIDELSKTINFYLDEANFSAYGQKFFKWITDKTPKMTKLEHLRKTGFCKLCEKLNHKVLIKPPLRNLDSWWFGGSKKTCRKDSDDMFGKSVRGERLKFSTKDEISSSSHVQ